MSQFYYTFYLAVEAGGAALHHLHVFDDRAERRLTLRLLLVLQTLQELVVLWTQAAEREKNIQQVRRCEESAACVSSVSAAQTFSGRTLLGTDSSHHGHG